MHVCFGCGACASHGRAACPFCTHKLWLCPLPHVLQVGDVEDPEADVDWRQCGGIAVMEARCSAGGRRMARQLCRMHGALRLAEAQRNNASAFMQNACHAWHRIPWMHACQLECKHAVPRARMHASKHSNYRGHLAEILAAIPLLPAPVVETITSVALQVHEAKRKFRRCTHPGIQLTLYNPRS